MRVLHQSDLCTLILGDARAPATRPDGQYDLLCTDPPYGISYKGAKFPEIQGDDGTVNWPTVLNEWVGNGYTRGLKERRHLYIFGYRPDHLAGPLRLGGTSELIWNKRRPSPGNLSAPWGAAHEIITFGVHTPSRADRAQGRGALSARLRQGSVLTVPPTSTAHRRHPNEKPLDLMTQLIESSTIRGDLVVDPVAGVGSTLVAAILTGRRAYGVEIEERYATIALDRVRRAEEIVRQATTV